MFAQFKGVTFEEAVEFIFGVLLIQKEYELAADFSRFLGEGNWAQYLKGRLYLATGKHTLAATSFRKAAFKLGKSSPRSSSAANHWPSVREELTFTAKAAIGFFNVYDADTANFIPPDQRDYFSDGLSKYYYHILGLFEKQKAYSYVADFAKLGLLCWEEEDGKELKTELLGRLFSSEVQVGAFEEAYSAVMRMGDRAL